MANLRAMLVCHKVRNINVHYNLLDLVGLISAFIKHPDLNSLLPSLGISREGMCLKLLIILVIVLISSNVENVIKQ